MTARVDSGETVIGEQTFTNVVALASGTSSALAEVSADYIYEYQPIRKTLTEMDGNWAYYQIDVNPDALDLVENTGEGGIDHGGLTLKDTFYYEDWTDQYPAIMAQYPNYVAQSIDYSSITVEIYEGDQPTSLTGRGKAVFEAAGISYDYSGYVGTFQFPDEEHIRITYRTRVSGDAGSVVTFLNDAVLTTKDSAEIPYSASVREENCLIYPGSDDLIGNLGDYYIRLFKYAEGNMEYGLSGAQFLLHDANMKPMYRAGHEGDAEHAIIFTTGEDGYALIRLDPEEYGFSLQKNTLYYLEEVEAPVGEGSEGSVYYKKDNNGK